MLRFVAITALAAALSSPALAEPGFVKTVNLAPLSASHGIASNAACELPVDLSTLTAPVAPATSQAMTLSPRMIQAIRIGEDASGD